MSEHVIQQLVVGPVRIGESQLRIGRTLSSQTGFNTTTGICRSVLVWYAAYGP